MKIELTQPEAERLLALLAEFPIKAAGDLFTKVQQAITQSVADFERRVEENMAQGEKNADKAARQQAIIDSINKQRASIKGAAA